MVIYVLSIQPFVLKTFHDALFMYIGCLTLSQSRSHISAPNWNIYKILSVFKSSCLALRSSSLSSSAKMAEQVTYCHYACAKRLSELGIMCTVIQFVLPEILLL